MTFVLFLKKQKQNNNKRIFPSYPVTFFKDYYPLKFVKE